MKFRSDINGLRAYAVIAVVIFHFSAEAMPGGFAGVDVFFVISGYLMTSIIFNGIDQNRFSIWQFYLARGRRIIPALAVLCIALLIYGWFFLLPTDYSLLTRNIAGSVSFISNFLYWREGYFTASALENWLLHTWSLSVEWQFYLVYPIFVVLLKTFMKLEHIKWVLLAGIVVSLLLSIGISGWREDMAFYLLPTRAWELLIGGMAFLIPVKFSARQGRLVEYLGIAMIVFGYFWISEDDMWPGYLALIPVIGTYLVIIAQCETSLLTQNKPFQWIGTGSYSIYLWHWPVVVYLNYQGLTHDAVAILIGIAVSLILGWLSYTLVEQRTRKKSYEHWWMTPYTPAALIIVIGFTFYQMDGAKTPLRPLSQSEQAAFVEEYKNVNVYEDYWLKCNTSFMLVNSENGELDPSCITKNDNKTGVFLWGDSFAEALSHGFRARLPAHMHFYQVTSAGCAPSIEDVEVEMIGGHKWAVCNMSNHNALKQIEIIKPEIVVMAQRDGHQYNDWEGLTKVLSDFGVKQIVLVGPFPKWNPSLPSVVVRRHWDSNNTHISDSALDYKQFTIDDILVSKLNVENLDYISVLDKLCLQSDEEPIQCQARFEDGSLLAFDYGHLVKRGSEFIVGEFVIPQFDKEFLVDVSTLEQKQESQQEPPQEAQF